jgi:hypothetical protein
MDELFIGRLSTDEAGAETPASIRERLKAQFPPGATRRMTTLGMLVGGALARLEPAEDDAVVYATGYSESCTLEAYLDSFPTPSPTLFQTSIHPSAVQQLMIARQQPVREFMPLSGGAFLAFHALRTCLLAPAGRILLCGGEERGTWLVEHGLASERTFGFAAALTREPPRAALGSIRLEAAPGEGRLGLAALFDLLHGREGFDGLIAQGWRMNLTWR